MSSFAPDLTFKCRESISPVSTIGISDKFRFTKMGLPACHELTDFGGPIDQNARRTSQMKADYIPVHPGKIRQKSKRIRAPQSIIETAIVTPDRPWQSSAHLPSPGQARDTGA